jgi:hypothetical protein
VQLSVNNQGTDYVIGTPASAVITIQDNEPTLSVTVVQNAARPSTPGTFRFSYPGVPLNQALDQSINVRFTFSGATLGTDFVADTTLVIPAGSPTRSADLIINPTATGTATSLTVTITSDTAYTVLSSAASATMTFTAASENDPSRDKPTPGTINSGSGGSSCGLGSGVAGFLALGLFVLLALRRRQH